ncbi:UNKNOWN [Stylonychia lemnae]|uniref:THAP4-like heme-binding domain-containing protein n=1 Tax=Stylonychia lemnae TaxID=5949 RepID=A0A078AJR2_STYLE|nr:UNKNOWN [Stylonychia lemnae]|eukprot:CDW81707.1 UNKNOWN [Stylonychia lemnae]
MDKLVFFLGKWKGKGVVLEKGVQYLEESTYIQLRSSPAIVINAQQFTKHAETGAPLHAENGFIKILPLMDGVARVEASFSHPFSLNEFEFGTFGDNTLTIEASLPEHFQRGKTAKGKQTTGLKREYWLNENGNLCYRIHLAVDGGELIPHLECEMEKQE